MAGPFSECSTEIIGESYVPSLEQHSAITRAQRRPRQEHAWTHTNHSSVYCSDSLTFSSDVVFFETCLDLAVRSAYMGHGSGLAFVPLSSGSIPQDQLETQLHPSMAVFRGAVEPANTSTQPCISGTFLLRVVILVVSGLARIWEQKTRRSQ